MRWRVTGDRGSGAGPSAFAAACPIVAPGWFYPAIVGTIGSLSVVWHIGITLIFGFDAWRRRYLRIERGTNGVAGLALIGWVLQGLLAR